jgi:NitT/TauT family transport system permease protein
VRPATAATLRGAAGLAVPLVALEVVARGGLVDAAILPPASLVLGAAAQLLADPRFLVHVAGTLAAWGLGLAVAALVAVPLGAVLGSSRPLRIAGLGVIELLRPIPSVALVPLLVLLLGRGLDMKVAVVAYASAWPILLNTITGVREVDPLARETARVYGLGRLATMRRVALPAAAPFTFTGLRISAAIALVVAVSAELIAGGGIGIGTWMLTVSQAGVPRELLYAGIVIAGLIGLAINVILVAADRRLFAWHHARRRTEL